jgi:hypothetical protein
MAPLLVERVVSFTDRLVVRAGRTSTGTSTVNGALQTFCCAALSGAAWT